MSFWVYLLRCADGSYYTGHNDNLEQRMGQHHAGSIPGCYTFNKRPLTLVWSQDFPSRIEALESEMQIKRWSRAKKEALIAGDWASLKVLAKSHTDRRSDVLGDLKETRKERGSTGSPRTEISKEPAPDLIQGSPRTVSETKLDDPSLSNSLLPFLDCRPSRLAVLVSGTGSNLQVLVDAVAQGNLAAEIVGVFSDKPQAPALQRVPAGLRWSADARAFPDRKSFDQQLADAISETNPDWVICAGYMRILGDAFIARFRGRLINIHPSLLPKYRGLRTHARALEAGDREHGASVHMVVPELDAGAVIAQARVPILAGDTPETLAQRLLPREHALLLAVLQLIASGRITEHDGRACLDGQPVFSPLHLDSSDTLMPEDSTPSP